jgi:hypothetical protein
MTEVQAIESRRSLPTVPKEPIGSQRGLVADGRDAISIDSAQAEPDRDGPDFEPEIVAADYAYDAGEAEFRAAMEAYDQEEAWDEIAAVAEAEARDVYAAEEEAWEAHKTEPPREGPDSDMEDAEYSAQADSSTGPEMTQPCVDGGVIIMGGNAATEILREDQVPREDGEVDGDDGAASGDIGPDTGQSDQRLSELTKQISRRRLSMLRAARTAVEAHIQIGQALIKAKALCRHGRWARFLQRCGLKQRLAEQCMQFARNSELIAQVSHGRADLTVEEVRKMIASHRRASGQDRRQRAASRSNPASIDQPDHAGEISGQRRADRPGGDTTDVVNRGLVAPNLDSPSASLFDPTSTETAPQPSTEDRGDDEVADADDHCSNERASVDLSLAEKLADRSVFDIEARFWFALRPAIDEIRKSASEDPAIRQALDRGFLAPWSFATTIARLIAMPHLERWAICEGCDGRCKVESGAYCVCCEGRGYRYGPEGSWIP